MACHTHSSHYDSLTVGSKSVKAGTNATATVTVSNTGQHDADEVTALEIIGIQVPEVTSFLPRCLHF